MRGASETRFSSWFFLNNPEIFAEIQKPTKYQYTMKPDKKLSRSFGLMSKVRHYLPKKSKDNLLLNL